MPLVRHVSGLRQRLHRHFQNYLGSSAPLVKLVHAWSTVRWGLSSRLVEDAQPEKVEAGAAIHLSFDELESMHLSFYRTVAPR